MCTCVCASPFHFGFFVSFLLDFLFSNRRLVGEGGLSKQVLSYTYLEVAFRSRVGREPRVLNHTDPTAQSLPRLLLPSFKPPSTHLGYLCATHGYTTGAKGMRLRRYFINLFSFSFSPTFQDLFKKVSLAHNAVATPTSRIISNRGRSLTLLLFFVRSDRPE